GFVRGGCRDAVGLAQPATQVDAPTALATEGKLGPACLVPPQLAMANRTAYLLHRPFPPRNVSRRSPPAALFLGPFRLCRLCRTRRVAIRGGLGFRRFRLGRGLGGLRLLLLAGLVRLAAIVGLVEPGALEQHRSARAKEPPQLVLLALRALLQRLVGE